MLWDTLRTSLNTLFLLFALAVHPSHDHNDKPTNSQNTPQPMNTASHAQRLTSLTSSPTLQLIDKNDHKSIIDHFYRSIKQIIPLQNFHLPAT